jgi:hypothetical protein
MLTLDFELGFQPSCSNTRHFLCETIGRLVTCFVSWACQVVDYSRDPQKNGQICSPQRDVPLLPVSIAYTPCSVDAGRGGSAPKFSPTTHDDSFVDSTVAVPSLLIA